MFRRKCYDRLLEWKRASEEIVLHPKQLKAEGRRVFLPLYMAHLV